MAGGESETKELPKINHECRLHAVFRESAEPKPLALIMVNYKLPKNILTQVWPKAYIHICADGAINRLFNTFDSEEERQHYIPEYVKGDCDSIEPAVREYYASKGTKIVYDSDQDTTDLEKCMELLESPQASSTQVVVLGAFGGRLDHEFSHYHVLYKYPDRDVVLLSSSRTAFLMAPGKHRILSDFMGPHCGLVPLGQPVRRITTRGLRWDMTDREMNYAGLISTSNRIEGDAVEVETTDPLLWVSELRPPGESASPPPSASA